MNRNILFFFTLMILAIIGACAVSAADVGTVSDVDINNVDDVVIVDEITDSADDEVVADDVPVEEEVIDDAAIDDEPAVDEPVIVEDDLTDDAPVDNLVDETSDYAKIMKMLYIWEITKDMNVFEAREVYKAEDYNPEDNIETSLLFCDMRSLYRGGYTVNAIAEEVNMTPAQVQDIMNYAVDPISNDAVADSVFKAYGSKTLEEIADDLGITTKAVTEKVLNIKKGVYGETYRRILIRRDLILIHDNHEEFIIR